MYIVFRGEVQVLRGDKKVLATYKEKEFLGRSALENDAPRNADLRAKGNTDIFILSRYDYQHCL